MGRHHEHKVDCRELCKEVERKIDLGYITISQLARNLGWAESGDEWGRGDCKRLWERLRKDQMKHDTAKKIIEAANLDPVDVGI